MRWFFVFPIGAPPGCLAAELIQVFIPLCQTKGAMIRLLKTYDQPPLPPYPIVR